MNDTPDDDSMPPLVIYLKRLVTVMTVVMIAGFLILIYMLVIRLNADPLPMPDMVTLPAGTTATAFTQGEDWFAVVTSDNEILIYNRGTGALQQTVQLEN